MTVETPIFSVTEISLYLKGLVEEAFTHVRVKGEVSGVKRASSGHIYFSIKDADSVLNAICWRGASKTTNDAIVEGMEIIATGKLSTYPGRSNYQMIVEEAEPAGIGALLKMLEELKKKLAAEGLFDESRKKKIPFLPTVIGVITSPTGAVIRDIMHRLNDRFPRHVLLWPVLVQGDGAAEQVATAIHGFNAMPEGGDIPKPDLLIVARGGGSLEDLWPFNDERVVRAVAASGIPIISAVGHETDTTLIDYASDLRAPTPTGAAEKAVPVRSEMILSVTNFQNRLADGLYRLLNEKQIQLKGLERGLPNLSDVIEQYVQRLDDQVERLDLAMHGFYTRASDRLTGAGRLLEAHSYERVLDKGFVLVTDAQSHPITSGVSAESKTLLQLHFKDKMIAATPAKSKKLSASSGEQGSLF